MCPFCFKMIAMKFYKLQIKTNTIMDRSNNSILTEYDISKIIINDNNLLQVFLKLQLTSLDW